MIALSLALVQPFAAARQIGIAQPPQHIRRESGAVVGDGDDDLAAGPGDQHLDLLARELDGVLQQVAEAVHDLRPARQHGIARLRRVGRELDAQRDVRARVRRRRQLHQQAGRQHVEMVLVLVGLARQLGQDLAAALALAHQQLGIGAMLRTPSADRAPVPWPPARWCRAASPARAPPRRPARRATTRAARGRAPPAPPTSASDRRRDSCATR